MQMEEGLDTGDMLLKGEVEITPETTGGRLHDALSRIGAELLLKTLDDWDNVKPLKQDEALTCYAAKIDKAESKLDFNQPAEILERKSVRLILIRPFISSIKANGLRFWLQKLLTQMPIWRRERLCPMTPGYCCNAIRDCCW